MHYPPLFLEVAPGHVDNNRGNDRKYQRGKYGAPDTITVDNLPALEIAESGKNHQKHNSQSDQKWIADCLLSH